MPLNITSLQLLIVTAVRAAPGKVVKALQNFEIFEI